MQTGEGCRPPRAHARTIGSPRPEQGATPSYALGGAERETPGHSLQGAGRDLTPTR